VSIFLAENEKPKRFKASKITKIEWEIEEN
jgi:hypothetical protein